MNSKATARNGFSTKPLVAAIAMALAAPAAFAAGMPGAGLVVRNMGNVDVNGVPLPGTNQIIGLNSGDTINSSASAGTVIQWGSPGVVDSANAPGFNLATGKTLNFTCVASCGWLNIDISGKLSQIDGKIVADANSVFAIANEKGITVGSGATITAPQNLALIGANLNTIDAINAFAAASAYQMNFAGSSPVTVTSGANLAGVGTSGVNNYLLVAGSGAVSLSGPNTKMPGALVPINVIGGVGSDVALFTGAVTLNDTGPASSTVRSTAPADVTIGLGTSATARDATLLTVYANGNLTNTGNLDLLTEGDTAYNRLMFTGTFNNTGTLQTTTAAEGINFPNFHATVPWYRNSAAQPAWGSFNNSGTIVAADGYVNLVGNSGDMTNSGKITAGNGYLDFYTHDGNVLNTATGDLTATSSVYLWAGSKNHVSTDPHDATNDGKITSTASYVDLYSEFGSVTNSATGVISAFTQVSMYANYSTYGVNGNNTNAGTINITGPDGSVYFYNYGPGNITVGGTVAAVGAGAYIGYFSAAHSTDASGSTTISTPITVLNDKGNTGIYLAGEKIVVSSKLTVAEETAGAGAGSIYFWGSNSLGANATTIGANLTAGSFYFDTYNGGGTGVAAFDMTVNLNGDLMTTAGGSRTVEFYDVANVTGPGVITANRVVFDTSGSVRNPVSPSNFLLNGVNITTVGTDPVVTVNARGPVKQFVNLAITGDATVTSGDSVSNFGPCYSGLCTSPSGGYIPEPNAGSSLLITANGNLTVGPNNYPNALYGGGQGGLSNTNGFLFPGSVVFVASGALNVNTVIDNAWTGLAVPFQGIWLEGATINALSPMYTNGNSLVNYSVRPNGGVGLATTYQAKVGTNFLGFPNLTAVLNPNNSYLNKYTYIIGISVAGGDWDAALSKTPFYQ